MTDSETKREVPIADAETWRRAYVQSDKCVHWLLRKLCRLTGLSTAEARAAMERGVTGDQSRRPPEAPGQPE